MTLAILAACTEATLPAEEIDDAAVIDVAAPAGDDVVEMRFGTIVTGGALDMDELTERNRDITTLTDATGTAWQLRWAFGTVEDAYAQMKSRGFSVEKGDADGFAARVGSDGGESCLALTGAEGIVLLHERPVAADEDCESFDAIAADLAWVDTVTTEAVLAVAHGTVVGTYDSTNAYSNGSTSYLGPYSTYGYQYQCPELINRYFVTRKGKANMRGTGNAKDYCSGRPAGYTTYSNGGTTAPKAGDFIVSKSGSYGHIAIVREVDTAGKWIKVIHQNWTNTSADGSKTITMSVAAGKYTVSGFSGSYSISCWGR